MRARIRLNLEAALWLLLARLALRLLPYRWMVWFFNRRVEEPQVAGTERARIRQNVALAVDRVATRLPGGTACFARGIAAQAMLRHRRIGTTLCYGTANTPDRGWIAHVWVMDGDEGVVGKPTDHHYHLLMRYPDYAP